MKIILIPVLTPSGQAKKFMRLKYKKEQFIISPMQVNKQGDIRGSLTAYQPYSL